MIKRAESQNLKSFLRFDVGIKIIKNFCVTKKTGSSRLVWIGKDLA